MDRHDISEEVTAENVAQLHQEDLKIQHKYNCKGLTYWFDAERKTAFCLIEAPNKESIKEMHDRAHGEVPHRIIEVDDAVVESFLGRIEDPEKSQNTELNIINDPAFRTIMVAGIQRLSLKNSTSDQLNSVLHRHNQAIVKTINKLKGSIVKQKSDYLLASFDSVTNAVLCALEIQAVLKVSISSRYDSDIKLNIGLSAGVPVTEKEGLFENTIKTAERLCYNAKGRITVTSEVKDLYESENLNISIDKKYINALHPNDEKFLNLLMDYIEIEWYNTTLNADAFCTDLGYSKSQLYRKMISTTGKSPNSFTREYRLNKSLELLSKQIDNITEIAFKTGFNSPAYFSKCFHEAFGILPSSYTKQNKLNTLPLSNNLLF